MGGGYYSDGIATYPVSRWGRLARRGRLKRFKSDSRLFRGGWQSADGNQPSTVGVVLVALPSAGGLRDGRLNYWRLVQKKKTKKKRGFVGAHCCRCFGFFFSFFPPLFSSHPPLSIHITLMAAGIIHIFTRAANKLRWTWASGGNEKTLRLAAGQSERPRV